MIRHVLGSSEYRKDAVSKEFDDCAAVLRDDVGHRLEVMIDDCDELFSGELCTECSKSSQVTHYDGNVFVLAAALRAFFSRENEIRNVFRCISDKSGIYLYELCKIGNDDEIN